MTATTQQDLRFDSRDETMIVAMVNKGNEDIASNSSSNSQNNTPNEDTRIKLLHFILISNHTEIDALFDSGSQANLIS